MDQLERVLYNNFKMWNNRTAFENTTIEEDFAEYMNETFQIAENYINILDILNTMILPEASEANAVRQNQISCSNGEENLNSDIELGDVVTSGKGEFTSFSLKEHFLNNICNCFS